MKGFFDHESAALRRRAETGRAIIRLIRSVGNTSPTSEYAMFMADPKAWLWKVGYRYDGPGAVDGKVPGNITLIPVFDTADTMHVRIPSVDAIDPPQSVQETDSYGPVEANRLPVLLASYFVRQCR